MTLAELYLSPNGRATRFDYWLRFYLPMLLVSIATAVVDFAADTYNDEYMIGLWNGLFSAIVLYPSLMVMVKRLHDRGRSGWFVLLVFVPLVNLWPLIEISFLRGTRGSNNYGPDPLEPQNLYE